MNRLAEDGGCSEIWVSIDEKLPATTRQALLCDPLVAGSIPFDPGLQGSYFQAPDRVLASIEELNSIAPHQPSDRETMALERYL